MWRIGLMFTLFVLGCETHQIQPAVRSRISAASVLAREYASSPFASWKVHVDAAGRDCAVLLVQPSIPMDDSLVEALHYGSGPYAAYGGGVEHFSRAHSFRAVAYRDASGHIWTYGAVDTAEAETLAPCS
jgi:hypothetical protein